MAVAQYTSAYTYNTTRQYTQVDNWAVTAGGAALSSIVQGTNTRTGKRALKCISLTSASNSVTTVDLDQRIESANMVGLLGQVAMAAQVYVNSGAAVTPVLMMGTPGASDNFTTTTTINNSGNGDALQACSAGAWTQVHWTADISGYANIANGLEVKLRFPDGALDNTRNILVSEFQLEPGSVATAFEILSYDMDLDRAQRHGAKIGGTAVYPIVSVVMASGDTWYWPVSLPKTMMATPTATVCGNWTTTNCGRPLIDSTGPTGITFGVNCTSSGTIQIYPTDATGFIWVTSRL